MAISLPTILRWFTKDYTNKIPAIVYTDPNSVIAVPTTELVMDAAGALTPKPGDTLQEVLTEKDATDGVLAFSKTISSISILNTDTSNNGIFTVNGIDIPVPSNLSFKDSVGGTPSNTVTITGATTYIVSRYSS